MNSYQDFRLYEIYDESKEYSCNNMKELRIVFNTLQPFGIMTLKNRIVFFLVLQTHLERIINKIYYSEYKIDFINCILLYCKRSVHELLNNQNNNNNWLSNIAINEAYKVIDISLELLKSNNS